MPLKQLGFHLLAIIGLSMAPARDSVNEMARGGAQFQDTTVDTRPFTLVGYIEGDDPQDLDRYRQALIDAFKLDSVTPRQPVTLQYQLTDCGEPVGDAVNILCHYQDGLRGNGTNNNQERLGIQFNMYMPLLVADGSRGANLNYQVVLTGTNYALARINGDWQKLGTGFNAIVYVIKSDPGTGRVYFGGAFTTANGVVVNRITYWDPLLQTFVAMLAGMGNQYVYDIEIAANHDVWVAGAFTLTNGVATKGLARWNYATSTWTVFNVATATFGGINDLAIGNDGTVYIGGAFTDWNGIVLADRFAKYSPAGVWASGGTALDGDVYALTVGPNGKIYVGGDFTVPYTRLMTYDPATSTFATVITNASWQINARVQTIAFSPSGIMAVGGDFTSPGNYLLLISGSSPHPFANGVDNNVVIGKWRPNGDLYLGGFFTRAGGLTINDMVVVYSHGAFTPLEVDLPGTPAIYKGIDFLGDDIYLGFDTAGTATVSSASTTLTNPGSAESYLKITMTGPATVVSIRNVTTGQNLYFDLTLQAGETAVLEISQSRVTFTSSFRGNILGTILPGSNQANFLMAPGPNQIAIDYSGTVSAATAFVLYWLPCYHGFDGLIPSRIIH